MQGRAVECYRMRCHQRSLLSVCGRGRADLYSPGFHLSSGAPWQRKDCLGAGNWAWKWHPGNGTGRDGSHTVKTIPFMAAGPRGQKQKTPSTLKHPCDQGIPSASQSSQRPVCPCPSCGHSENAGLSILWAGDDPLKVKLISSRRNTPQNKQPEGKALGFFQGC